MLERLHRLHPFQTPRAQRLALLFAVVYFAQGMWYLPNQAITIVLKDRGLTAAQVAAFFTMATVPWLIKPVYGLISDFVPLWGRRRKSYFLLAAALAAACGAALALVPAHGYWTLAVLFTVMGLGLAFTDVLTDAFMVESGRPLGLTGAFQSVQWAAIYASTIIVGVVGGALAEHRNLHAAFALAACFPVVSFVMALRFVDEPPARSEAEAFAQTWAAIRDALRQRDVWVVAGFVFFFNFSPSFGPALIYYQTDVLGFSQNFIGLLGSLGAVGAVVGAFLYAPLSRRVSLRRLIPAAIVAATVGTLVYLLYRSWQAAVAIDLVFGCVAMMTQLAFLELAARACPRRVEATFFALLMSVFNGGTQVGQITGGHLYDRLGYAPLILISAGMTALALLLVPLVRIDRIEAAARAAAPAPA